MSSPEQHADDPGGPSGVRSATDLARSLTSYVPKEALLAVVPVLIAALGAAALTRRRSSDTSAQAPLTERLQARGGSRKPRNLMRYYSIGLLINMLERDATRKALITGLKWARHRA